MKRSHPIVAPLKPLKGIGNFFKSNLLIKKKIVGFFFFYFTTTTATSLIRLLLLLFCPLQKKYIADILKKKIISFMLAISERTYQSFSQKCNCVRFNFTSKLMRQNISGLFWIAPRRYYIILCMILIFGHDIFPLHQDGTFWIEKTYKLYRKSISIFQLLLF